jgi:hypothetical protein
VTTFTAYFDESGTHSAAEVSVMAGFVGDARQWRKFEKRAGKLFGRYHVDIFHTIDVRRGDADFQGWTVDRKLKFLDELQHIANDTLLGGVTSVIRKEDYEYYSGLSWPTKTRRDSKYGIIFRGCISRTHDPDNPEGQECQPRRQSSSLLLPKPDALCTFGSLHGVVVWCLG